MMKDEKALEFFGMTITQARAEKICARCRKPILLEDYKDEWQHFLAFRTYQQYGLCQPCLPKFTEELWANHVWKDKD